MTPRWQCANCGIVFSWRPTVIRGTVYCCVGCSRGGPCTCDYARLPFMDQSLPLAKISRQENILPASDAGATPADDARA
ncbi:MAG: hypothetical protein ACUVWB_01645 [Anaerolineae bacterium]